MGKAVRASALVLLLACSAQAGYMQNETPAPAPSPVPTVTSDETIAEGYLLNDITQDETTNPVTLAALDVVAALSSLL